MNPFESALASALRDEVQEIAMSTSLEDGRDALDRGMARVDGRRRWAAIGGMAAAVVLIAAVAIGVLTRPGAVAPPAAPSPAPSSSAASLVGVWTAALDKGEVPRVLAEAGLEEAEARVLQELSALDEVSTWQLWVDPTAYRLYLVADDGALELFDVHEYTRDGSRIEATTLSAPPLLTVSDVEVDGTTLTWRVMSSEVNPDAGAVPEEAMQRVLYATSTWTKAR